MGENRGKGSNIEKRGEKGSNSEGKEENRSNRGENTG